MIWGSHAVQHIASLPATSKYLLGFNEPNILVQSNMTPAEACALWPLLEAANKTLGSPAVNHCHAEPEGHCTSEPGSDVLVAPFFALMLHTLSGGG